MRAAVAGLVLLLAVRPGWAGEVPDPLFWASEADFLEQVEGGQFIDRLELHLLQYAADPRWRSEWAALRYSGNGLFGEFGSTTGTELYVNSQIAVNLFPAKWLQMRYDRRDYQDGRFEVSDQRFDAVFHLGSGWGPILTGWPAFDKEVTSMGIGVRLGAPKARNALEVLVVDERVIWDEKTDDEVRFDRDPWRILLDGSYEAGFWRVHGTVDFGLEYAATDGATGRTTRGSQRFGDAAVGHVRGDWSVGLRLTGARLERDQTEAGGGRYALDRSWGRAVVSCRRQLGKWGVSALLGYAAQRDDFASPDDPEGRYDLGSVLFGVEGELRLSRVVELRLGYLGSSQDARREVTGNGALPAREEDDFIDKAHLKALFTFAPAMSIELLLSQAIQGGSFGGGSVKALLVF